MRISKVDLCLRGSAPMELPPFAGSTIRGAFGNLLKETVCVQHRRSCQSCMLRGRCTYTYLFESGWYFSTGDRPQAGVPQPFVFEPPANRPLEPESNTIQLGLLLYGDAIDYLPYFTYCFEQLGKVGLGRHRAGFVLENVRDVFADQAIINAGSTSVITRRPRTRAWDDYQNIAADTGLIGRCRIEFVTPLRVKQEGHLQDQVSFDLLIRAIIRRWMLLCKYYGPGFDTSKVADLVNRAKTIPSGTLNLRWQEWERYSRRQDQRMAMGGMVGIMECEGELTPFWPWLLIGQDIHVGKNTSFGLGKYRASAIK